MGSAHGWPCGRAPLPICTRGHLTSRSEGKVPRQPCASLGCGIAREDMVVCSPLLSPASETLQPGLGMDRALVLPAVEGRQARSGSVPRGAGGAAAGGQVALSCGHSALHSVLRAHTCLRRREPLLPGHRHAWPPVSDGGIGPAPSCPSAHGQGLSPCGLAGTGRSQPLRASCRLSTLTLTRANDRLQSRCLEVKFCLAA